MKGSLNRIMASGVAPARDPRADALRSHGRDIETEDMLRALLPGLSSDKLAQIQRAKSEIQVSWSGARQAFIQIGRALLALDRHLDDSDQARVRAVTDAIFPFKEGVAVQLKLVARAVDEGRIPEAQCPATYSVAYRLARLDDLSLKAAAERGFIRNNVTRAELNRFAQERMNSRRSRTDPEARGRRLLARRASLQREIAEIDRILKHLGVEAEPQVL